VVTVLYSVQREIGTCNPTLQNAVEYLNYSIISGQTMLVLEGK
jgi:hypothetical protein